MHLDGRRVLACLTFAVMGAGREITTIKGLSAPGAALHPMQQALIDHDAFQCGYCTPGQIVAADVVRTCEYMYLSLRGLDDHRCCDRIGRGGQLRRH